MRSRDFKAIFLIISFTLVGCASIYGERGVIKDRDTEYRTEQDSPPLTLPSEFNSAQIGDDYEVPNTVIAAPAKSVKITPPGSIAEQVEQGKLSPKQLKELTKKSRHTLLTENSTLIVDQDIDAVWLKLSKMLNKMGYKLTVSNEKLRIYYVLDTTVTHGRITAKTPIYQIHLRPTTTAETEIYVTDNDSKKVTSDISQRILCDINDGLHGKIKTPLGRLILGLVK